MLASCTSASRVLARSLPPAISLAASFQIQALCEYLSQEPLYSRVRDSLRACECFEVPLVVSAMVVEENALASFNELGIR